MSRDYLAENPLCVGWPRGVHGNQPVLATVTDHRLSTKTHPHLWFSRTNLAGLCVACNVRKSSSPDPHDALGHTSRR